MKTLPGKCQLWIITGKVQMILFVSLNREQLWPPFTIHSGPSHCFSKARKIHRKQHNNSQKKKNNHHNPETIQN